MDLRSLTESESTLAALKNDPKAVLSQECVAEAIVCLVTNWEATKRSNYMKGVGGAPDWLEYEFRIWELGETLRPFLRNKRWRGRSSILDVASDVLSNESFGKGRQSFALLIGDFGNGEYVEVLGQGLSDPEVRGHCLNSLNKAKTDDFVKEAEQILRTSNGWIRSAARRYLSRASK